MELLAWVFVGTIVGILAKFILRDFSRVSWMLTIILSITGAVVAGLLSATISLTIAGASEIGSVGTMIAGSVSVLLVHHIFEKY